MWNTHESINNLSVHLYSTENFGFKFPSKCFTKNRITHLHIATEVSSVSCNNSATFSHYEYYT